MEHTSQQIRHSFGILFLSVAISVAAGSIFIKKSQTPVTL